MLAAANAPHGQKQDSPRPPSTAHPCTHIGCKGAPGIFWHCERDPDRKIKRAIEFYRQSNTSVAFFNGSYVNFASDANSSEEQGYSIASATKVWQA